MDERKKPEKKCVNKSDVKTDYTREELIEICERAIVAEENWHNRDSASSQTKVGQCWALLKAGCKFKIEKEENNISTNWSTIWLHIYFDGFAVFEGTLPKGQKCEELYYLPTPGRLDSAQGGDWY